MTRLIRQQARKRTPRQAPRRTALATCLLTLGGLLGGALAVAVAVAGPAAAAAPAVDALVSGHQSVASGTITSPAFSTAQPGELLLAFLSSDGPSTGGASFASVSGGGLTWTLRVRSNAQPGTAEVWQAVAGTALANATVGATRSSGSWLGSITVVSFTGASTTANGATSASSGATGAPSTTLSATSAGSLVWGVGSDWTSAAARTVGAGQALVDQYLAPSGDTYWVQRQTSATAAAGSSVTIDDTAPTADRWDLAAVEVVPAGGGGAPGADQVGQWGPVISYPEVSIHAALLPDGKVLTWQGDFTQGGQQYVFDPGSGAVAQVPNAAADLFCAGQAVTADGRVLVIGGTSTSGGLGLKAVTAFDWATRSWQQLAPMSYARWYATGTTMGDGRVLVTSGDDRGIGDVVPIPEIYDVGANSWTALPGASNPIPVYPFVYQLPDGRLLQAGASETATSTQVLDVAQQRWTVLDGRVIDGGSIVDYAPGKFMKAGSATDDGGSGSSASTAFTLDLGQPSPTWQPTGSMGHPRSFLNLTALPDGNVLATGGGTDKSGYVDANAVLPAEEWTPATGTWKELASMSVPRLYHSVAILLPDGRVLVSGGGGDLGVTDQRSVQIYSPPYLFKGPRPTITAAPGTLQYGGAALLQTPDAASIASVSLIRTGSATHAFDQNARALPLSFTRVPGGLQVQLPPGGNTAPPGYYLLFIVNGQGVPSVAATVRFPAPSEDTVAPTTPANLTVTGASANRVDLGWSASSDNVGVTGYDILRDGTRIGSSTATSYADTSTIAGTTYSYTVSARDAAGNTSPPSNAVTVTTPANQTLALDQQVVAHPAAASASISSPALSTRQGGELLLALVSADGPSGAGSQQVASVTGAGLSWSLRARANAQPGTAEVWQAVAPSALSNATVTATLAKGPYLGSLVVASFIGAATGAGGAAASVAAASGAPAASLGTTKAGSWVWGVGTDWDAAKPRTVGSGQVLADQYLAPSGDTYWVQRQASVTATAGTTVTINDTAPTSDRWDLAAVEVPPA